MSASCSTNAGTECDLQHLRRRVGDSSGRTGDYAPLDAADQALAYLARGAYDGAALLCA